MLRSFLSIRNRFNFEQLVNVRLSRINLRTMSSVSASESQNGQGNPDALSSNMDTEQIMTEQASDKDGGDDRPKEIKYTLIKEGQAEIFQPETVFYNPVQEFNRDISIHVIDTYLKHGFWQRKKRDLKEEGGCRILEAFSASGLRSCRYAKEIRQQDLIKEIIANDLSLQAVETVKKNIAHNGIESKVKANHADATLFMYNHRQYDDRFQVVDIDPYGGCAPFLDAAVQSVHDGGLLAITTTDTAILCGNHPESCFARYGSMAMHQRHCHEFALRVLLRSIDTHANTYSRYIEPLLAISVDFYMRVFVRIKLGAAKAKESAHKSAMVFDCPECNTFSLVRLADRRENLNAKQESDKYLYSPAHVSGLDGCKHCGHKKLLMGGPIWADSLHDSEFVKLLAQELEQTEDMQPRFGTQRRMYGMLRVIQEELTDAPLYSDMRDIYHAMRCPAMPRKTFRSAILNAGYHVSNTHCNPRAQKFDAPKELIWDILREWIHIDPERLESVTKTMNELPDTHPVKVLFLKPRNPNINFADHPDAIASSEKEELLRYQQEFPERWGPKSKPKNVLNDDDTLLTRKSKQKDNQGKRSFSSSTSPPVDFKQFACKRFKAGTCTLSEEECRYSHKTDS